MCANIKSGGSPGNKMKAVCKLRETFCKLHVWNDKNDSNNDT